MRLWKIMEEREIYGENERSVRERERFKFLKGGQRKSVLTIII